MKKELVNEINNMKIVLAPICLDSFLTYHRIKANGMKVECFFDNNVMLTEKKYDGTIIRKPYYSDNFKVIISNEKHKYKIKEQYISMGYLDTNILFIEELEISYSEYRAAKDILIEEFIKLRPEHKKLGAYSSEYVRCRKMQRFYDLDPSCSFSKSDLTGYTVVETWIDSNNIRRLTPMRVELVLTNKCTLKCKCCSAWMQYYQEPCHSDVDVICDSYNQLLDAIDWTDEIVIMGGEPLLYPNIKKVIEYVGKHVDTKKKVGHVVLITNGTVLVKEEILLLLKKYDICTWISNYGKLGRNRDRLIQLMEQIGSSYDVINMRWWSDVMRLENPECDKKLENRRHKSRCVTRCRTVKEGKFYLCSVLKSEHELKASPHDDRNYVLLGQEDTKEKLYQYLNAKSLLPPGCAWCSGCKEEDWIEAKIPVAEQIAKPLEYIKYI